MLIRVYQPVVREVGALLPAIVFIHGGGFVADGVSGWDYAGDRHARTVPAVVVAPEYRVAPEHPFPGSRRSLRDAALARREGG